MAQLAATRYSFPAGHLRVIGVTGTSGKSTTVEIIRHILQSAGQMTGAISTVQVHIGDESFAPPTLRTTQKPSYTQQILHKMVEAGVKNLVIEVSSHAIDQHRLWGVNIDTAVLTNIFDNEHLDYHGTFEDYVSTKGLLFQELNSAARKPGIEKMTILPADDAQFERFNAFPCDKKWTFAKRKNADIKAENVEYKKNTVEFDLRLPNAQVHISAPIVGAQNLENLLCAITVALSHGVPAEDLPAIIASFKGVPGRLERIDQGQEFETLVDFTYKPSALQSVLGMLSKLKKGKLIVLWGGAYGRTKENYEACAQIIDQFADEFILTTDDPGKTNPKLITQIVKGAVARVEGDGRFWDIPDRYEAIRYALMTAEKGDTVLIAGRGHETVQTIGSQEIELDDREVCREVLAQMGFMQ